MRILERHPWTLSPQQAVTLQLELARQVVADRPVPLEAVRLVAGVDVSVKNNISRAAVVVLTYPDLQLVEAVTAVQPTPFPYIPGLLSFREGPVLQAAFEQMQHEPDVFIFDGMGIMHPRRIGIASHMGLWLDKPTIGCGKSYFIGSFAEPGQEKGAFSDLIYDREKLGVVLRTRTGVKPVFVSPGHLADIPSSAALVLNCTGRYRLPEPIRMAHNTAGNF